MGRTLSIVWLAVVVAVFILIGQTAGLYDVPVLRDVHRLLPVTRPQPEPARTNPTGSASNGKCRGTAGEIAAPARTEECNGSSPPLSPRNGRAESLGAPMRERVECERVIGAAGNRAEDNLTPLTIGHKLILLRSVNGFDHWTLSANGVVRWTAADLEPPTNAAPDRLTVRSVRRARFMIASFWCGTIQRRSSSGPARFAVCRGIDGLPVQVCQEPVAVGRLAVSRLARPAVCASVAARAFAVGRPAARHLNCESSQTVVRYGDLKAPKVERLGERGRQEPDRRQR